MPRVPHPDPLYPVVWADTPNGPDRPPTPAVSGLPDDDDPFQLNLDEALVRKADNDTVDRWKTFSGPWFDARGEEAAARWKDIEQGLNEIVRRPLGELATTRQRNMYRDIMAPRLSAWGDEARAHGERETQAFNDSESRRRQDLALAAMRRGARLNDIRAVADGERRLVGEVRGRSRRQGLDPDTASVAEKDARAAAHADVVEHLAQHDPQRAQDWLNARAGTIGDTAKVDRLHSMLQPYVAEQQEDGLADLIRGEVSDLAAQYVAVDARGLDADTSKRLKDRLANKAARGVQPSGDMYRSGSKLLRDSSADSDGGEEAATAPGGPEGAPDVANPLAHTTEIADSNAATESAKEAGPIRLSGGSQGGIIVQRPEYRVQPPHYEQLPDGRWVFGRYEGLPGSGEAHFEEYEDPDLAAWKSVTSFAGDMLPILGSVKSVEQLITGKDLISGEPINRPMEAAGLALGIIPGGKLAAKGFRTLGRKLGSRASQKHVAKYVAQGFTLKQAEYLAQPYKGMGHHFIPRRTGLPKKLSDSSLNVLKPRGMTRGEFYELHFKVDPKFFGARFPKRVGGSWSGRRLGLEKYDRAGRLWHGSPSPLKATVGGAAAGGTGAYLYGDNEHE
ncbi:pre-toxin TG domain-containing protein [Flavisphingomonas formosensis]|uniref:pre-toxin TG domain-containing protein n=1 Tax=Flavisphingomonas formosensis TaxID=861534 RepID=UPI0012F71699|nr:pre-toxin TG domain-containing protein [Sphingomonas formosensis]